MAQGDGLKACEEAFERLLNGCPIVAEHVGMDIEEITPSKVSVEAGFDRGYLKSSRKNHQVLIALINSTKKNVDEKDKGHREKLRRAKSQACAATQSESEMKAMLDRVLTQNLMLVERVRELEEQLKSREKSFPLKTNLY